MTIQESDFCVVICIDQAVFVGLLSYLKATAKNDHRWAGVATIFSNAPSAVFNRSSWKGIDHHNRLAVFVEKGNAVPARFIGADFPQDFLKCLRGLLIL